MKKLLLSGMIGVMIGLAQDKPVPLSREGQLEVELLGKDQQEAEVAIQHLKDLLYAGLNSRKVDLFARWCGAANIPVESCKIDAQSKTVSKIPPPAPAPSVTLTSPAAKK